MAGFQFELISCLNKKTSTIVSMLYFIRDRNEEIWYQSERYNANMNVGEDRWSQNDKIIVR